MEYKRLVYIIHFGIHIIAPEIWDVKIKIWKILRNILKIVMRDGVMEDKKEIIYKTIHNLIYTDGFVKYYIKLKQCHHATFLIKYKLVFNKSL